MNGSVVNLNCVGMQCPAPILAISKAAKAAPRPTRLEVTADDGDFAVDVRAWCRSTGAVLESLQEVDGTFVARIALQMEQRGTDAPPVSRVARSPHQTTPLQSSPTPVSAVPRGQHAQVEVDCRGMQCPAPILHITRAARAAVGPTLLVVLADDDDFPPDLDAWCRSTGAALLELQSANGEYVARVGLNGAGRVMAPAATSMPQVERAQPVPVSQPIHATPHSVDRQMAKAANRDAVGKVSDPGKAGNRPGINGTPTPPAVTSSTPAGPPSEPPMVVDLRGQPSELALLSLGRRVLDGEVVRFVADHGPIERQVVAWAAAIGASVDLSRSGAEVRGTVRIAGASHIPAVSQPAPTALAPQGVPRLNKATFLVLRNDFESLMAAMMVATASAAQGMEVEMFFSFWGVNVLRTPFPRRSEAKSPNPLKKMMKWMMPAGPEAQTMSKMHFGGAGLGMMKHFMKEQEVMTLAQLMRQAVDSDVKFVVCTMSMGIMGIEKSDLMDLPNISYGGVTSFTASARESALSMVF